MYFPALPSPSLFTPINYEQSEAAAGLAEGMRCASPVSSPPSHCQRCACSCALPSWSRALSASSALSCPSLNIFRSKDSLNKRATRRLEVAHTGQTGPHGMARASLAPCPTRSPFPPTPAPPFDLSFAHTPISLGDLVAASPLARRIERGLPSLLPPPICMYLAIGKHPPTHKHEHGIKHVHKITADLQKDTTAHSTHPQPNTTPRTPHHRTQ